MRVAIFQNDLKMGGIQKSLIEFINFIKTVENIEVTLFLFSRENFLSVPKGVIVKYIKSSFFYKIIPFSIAKFLTKRIDETYFDLVIDYSGFNSQTSAYTLKVNSRKKVIYIHSDIEKRLENNFKYRIIHFLTSSKYKYFDEHWFVSKGVFNGFENTLFKPNNFRIIGNLIDRDNIIKLSNYNMDIKFDESKINLLFVGRLSHEKNLMELIIILNELNQEKKLEHLSFYIIGDGKEEIKLKKYVDENNLNKKVIFLGRKNNPYAYMKRADYLILNSKYEGQPIVLIESLFLNTPVIIPDRLISYTDSIGGVSDLKNHLKNLKKVNKDIKIEKNNYLEKNKEFIIKALKETKYVD